MTNRLRENRAFTLIELIVVIAVIGILTLLAAPKFLGHTENARMAQIKSDIATQERIVEAERIEFAASGSSGDPFINGAVEVDKPTMVSYANNEELFHRGGAVLARDLSSDSYYKIKDNEVKSKLNGSFFMDEEGKVFYHEPRMGDRPEGEDPNAPEVDDNGYVKLTDADFEFVDSTYIYEPVYINGEKRNGYFHYIGEHEKVRIPHEIMGVKVTSYQGMFAHNEGIDPMSGQEYKGNNGEAVIAVFSDNKNVTNMKEMFRNSQASSLDLSRLDTSNVTHTDNMFKMANIPTIDLSYNDLSSLAYMRGMFSFAKSELIDLSNFEFIPGKIIDEGLLFYQAEVDLVRAKNESSGMNLSFLVGDPNKVTWDGKQTTPQDLQ